MAKEGEKGLEMARLLRAKRGSIASLAVSSLRDSQEAQYRLRLAIENRKYEIMKQKEPKRPNKPAEGHEQMRGKRPDCSGPDPCRFDRHGYWLYGREAGKFNKMPVEILSEKGPSKRS